MGVRRFLHVKIDVADLDRSLAFYCHTLGFDEVVRYSRQDGVTIVQISPDGTPVGVELWHEPPHLSFASARLHVALEVEDLDGVLSRLANAGYPIAQRPFKIGHERIAFVEDPDGYLLELNEADPK